MNRSTFIFTNCILTAFLLATPLSVSSFPAKQESTSSRYLQPEELTFSGKGWEGPLNNISLQNDDSASGKIEGRKGLVIEYTVEGLAVQSNESFYPSAVIDGYPTGSQVTIQCTVYGPYSITGSWATDGDVRLNNEKIETFRAPDSNGAPGWSFSPKPVVVTITDEIRANGFSVSVFLGYASSAAADEIWVTVTGLKGNPPSTNPIPIVAPLVPPAVTFPDSGARFSDLSGQVEVLIPKGYMADGEPDWDEEAWTIAKLDMTLPEGTRIKTSDRSTVILSFADMTTFSMKPETEIYLSKPQAKPGQFKLLGGQLWINFKRMIKDGSMEIEMGQAVTGIKGTTLVLEDDGTSSTVKVIEGTVEFTSKATGESRDGRNRQLALRGFRGVRRTANLRYRRRER